MSRESVVLQQGFCAADDVIDELPGPGCAMPVDRRAFLKLVAALPCLAAAFPEWLAGPLGKGITATYEKGPSLAGMSPCLAASALA